MKKRLRAGLIAVLLLVFLGSAGMMVRQALQYREGQKIYDEAAKLAEVPDLPDVEASQPPAGFSSAAASSAASSGAASSVKPASKPVYVDPYADLLKKMDFTSLRKVNDDILGWILIPHTVISYPLLQGEDNSYYLTHTYKKTTSVVGAIFMEYRCSPDLSDFNTIIYGHRMNNGSMFATLKNYRKQSYWKAHPSVYVTDDSGSHRYDIFAAYEVSTEGDTFRIAFSSDKEKQAFLDACTGLSVIDTGITPTVGDRVLTLSTCTGNGHATRWIVQAVLHTEAAAG